MMLLFLRDVGENNMTWSILVLLREWYLSFAFCLKHFIRWLAIAVGHQKGSMVGEKRQTEEKTLCRHLCIPVCMYVCENVCTCMSVGICISIVSTCPGTYLGSISTYARMHAYLYYYASMKSSMHVNVSVYTYVTHGWLMLAELSSQTIHVWKKDQNIGAKDIGRVGWSLVGLLTLMSCLTCVI